jgi:hypothetical protein
METNKDQQMPRARSEGLLFSPLNDELVVYDTERDQAHSLNRTTRLVWHYCDGQTSVAQVAELLARELQAQVDEQVVWLALQQLEQNHLLQTPLALPAVKISRRALARRVGLIAAAALPVVTSLAVPPAVAAVSATSCFFDTDCPPGQVCQGGVCVSGGGFAPSAPQRRLAPQPARPNRG